MNQVINPYIAGNPVTGTDMFFGRQDVFEFVRRNLTGKHQDQVIVLYGQRRTGKTSVLYQIHHYLSERYLCIFVDLHGLALESLDGFLWELANQIRRFLEKDYQIKLPQVDQADFFIDSRTRFEENFLNELWAATGDRHVLLMMDEAARLQEQVEAGKLETEIYEYLRHLMQHHERLNFLFSIGTGLEALEKQYTLLFNVALYKKISFLDSDEAKALITEPVRELYEVTPSAVEHILNITSGHPYYTQLICHSIFNHWQEEGQTTIDVDDVNTILEEVVERGLAVLRYVWEESNATEKAILAGMASVIDDTHQTVSLDRILHAWAVQKVKIPKGEAVTAIESLVARDVITGGDRYAFTVALQQMWVKKQRRLEWVTEEIIDKINDWRGIEAKRRNKRILSLLAVLLMGLFAVAAVFYYPIPGLRRGDATLVSVSDNTIIDSGSQDFEATLTATAGPQPVDSDGDGLSDEVEAVLVTQDSDGDGLSDLEEVQQLGTNPLKSDTDEDTIPDNQEIDRECLSPIKSDTDGDGISDSSDSDPCATSTPTPTSSNTPSPSPSPTQTSTPTATVEPTSTTTPTATLAPSATIAVNLTPTITAISTSTSSTVTETVEPDSTPVDEPSSAPTGDGDILFTTLNRIYSIDLNGQNEREHGEARPGENTCGAQAQTALGETFELHFGPYCGIGDTGTGQCASPDKQHEVITHTESASETSIVVRPIGTDQTAFVFDGKLDRGEGIRWAPNSDKFLFVVDDTVYAASLDGSYNEIIPTAYQPQFSPDGDLILYTKPVGPGIVDIFVSNADGIQSHNVTNAAFDHEAPLCPRWSRP